VGVEVVAMNEQAIALSGTCLDTPPRGTAPPAPVHLGAKAMQNTSRFIARPFVRIAAGVLLFASIALAANPIRIDCSAMPFDDGTDDAGVLKPIDEVGVDLAYDGGLIVVFTPEGDGALGNVLVPGYDAEAVPKDAMGRVLVQEFLCRSCIIRAVPDGMTFVLDDVVRPEAQATTLERLEAIGCTIGDAFATHAFAFACGGETLRAVFSHVETGTQVYLGY
jgi:hypothetical protein